MTFYRLEIKERIKGNKNRPQKPAIEITIYFNLRTEIHQLLKIVENYIFFINFSL